MLCQLTPLGRGMLEPGRRGALQALLFRHLYWHVSLSQFLETFPRRLTGQWPQDVCRTYEHKPNTNPTQTP